VGSHAIRYRLLHGGPVCCRRVVDQRPGRQHHSGPASRPVYGGLDGWLCGRAAAAEPGRPRRHRAIHRVLHSDLGRARSGLALGLQLSSGPNSIADAVASTGRHRADRHRGFGAGRFGQRSFDRHRCRLRHPGRPERRRGLTLHGGADDRRGHWPIPGRGVGRSNSPPGRHGRTRVRRRRRFGRTTRRRLGLGSGLRAHVPHRHLHVPALLIGHRLHQRLARTGTDVGSQRGPGHHQRRRCPGRTLTGHRIDDGVRAGPVLRLTCSHPRRRGVLRWLPDAHRIGRRGPQTAIVPPVPGPGHGSRRCPHRPPPPSPHRRQRPQSDLRTFC